MSSFQAVYGRDPPPLLAYVYREANPLPVSELLYHKDQILQQLKINLSKAQDRMKKYADKICIEVSFNIGEWVLAKLQP